MHNCCTDDTIPEKNWDEKVIKSADWSQEIVLNTSDGTENVDKRPYMVKTVILSKKDIKNWVIFYTQSFLMFIVIIFIPGYLIEMM